MLNDCNVPAQQSLQTYFLWQMMAPTKQGKRHRSDACRGRRDRPPSAHNEGSNSRNVLATGVRDNLKCESLGLGLNALVHKYEER